MIPKILYGVISAGIHAVLAAPGSLSVEVAGTAIEVTYNAVPGATAYEWRQDSAGSWTNVGNALAFSSTSTVGAHTLQVRAVGGIQASVGFTIDAAPSADPNLITGVSLSNIRNDFTGEAGIGITLGPTDHTITGVRIFVPGTGSRTVKIRFSDGTLLSTVTVTAIPGAWARASLPAPLHISQFNQYFIMMDVVNGGNAWYDNSIITSVSPSDLAGIGSAYYDGSNHASVANDAFGIVDIEFT